MTEKKSPLAELELHVKNIPKQGDCHPAILNRRREKWYVELVGKTQELSLSVAGKERSLRKLLQELRFHIVDYLLKTCVFDNNETILDTLSEGEWNIIDTTMKLSELLGGSQEPRKENL